jgi:hypothetical protein
MAMSALSLLGIVGVAATNRLISADLRFGLISWEDDRLFLVTAYGSPVLLALLGALGTAHLLRRHLF